MPRPKTPQQLYRLCVAYVVERIQSLCPPHDAVSNAFPPRVNEDLVLAVKRVRGSNLACLEHLLMHRVSRIELRFDFHCDSWPHLLSNRISQHADELVELSLDEPTIYVVRKGDSALVGALSKLRRLRRLSLGLPVVSDRVVVAIAKHCSELCELELSGGLVTDKGLCRLVACSQLHTLLLEAAGHPHVTEASALQLLRGLRHLRTLRAPFLADALLSLPADCRLPLLTECTLSGVSNLWESTEPLPHIVSVCPQLTRVSLDLSSQDGIQALAQLKALAELTLRLDTESNEDYFYWQLEPVLRTVGPNLRKLALGIQYLDLATISRLCPALIVLEVENLSTLTLTDQPCAQPSLSFPQLQRLKFFPRRRNRVTSEQLFQILSSCDQLVWAHLGNVKLTDAVLQELVESGALRTLCKLKLHAVRPFTVVGIWSLVMADSELASLKVIDCDTFNWSGVDDLSAYAANNNLDLVIEYAVI